MTNRFKISMISILVSAFAIFDGFIFYEITSVLLPPSSESVRAKSIDVPSYLPFKDDSLIVKKRDDTFTFDEGERPVIDCATALYPVASGIVNAIYDKSDVQIEGNYFTADSKLQLNNTVGAYKALAEGNSDIGILAKPSQEQIEYAKSLGCNLKLEPIGYDAFVFLVNANNPVENLSSDQIRSIFKGRYKNWNELCDFDKQITPILRSENSGSETAFKSFIGSYIDTSELSDTSLSRQGSPIGYSFRFYVENVVNNGRIKMIGLDGIEPTKQNIIKKQYPLISSFYAVYDANNTNPNVLKVVNWIKGTMGQELIDETGYVKL